MNDREILELAAKVENIEIQGWDGKNPLISDPYTRLWNPLKDDGDAFRLMVKLNDFEPYRSNGGFRLTPNLTIDAHRASIFRAAVELGKTI